MKNKPTICIIAQNIFIAIALSLLANAKKGNSRKILIIPSVLEKNFLRLFYGTVFKNYELISLETQHDMEIDSLDNMVESTIEFKRGMQAKHSLEKLSCSLIFALNSLHEPRNNQIKYWIFNRHTWIAFCLRKLKKNNLTLVFENANRQNALCLTGDLFAQRGEVLRSSLQANLNDTLVSSLDAWVTKLRFIRPISLLLHISKRGGLHYYVKKIVLRNLNVLFLKFIDFKVSIKLRTKIQNVRKFLVVLQIENDSTILCQSTISSYRKAIICSIMTHTNANDTIVLKIHPKDTTLGWVYFLFEIKRHRRKVEFSVSSNKKINLSDYEKIITFSSNFVRTVNEESMKRLLVVGSYPELYKVDLHNRTYFKGIFK